MWRDDHYLVSATSGGRAVTMYLGLDPGLTGAVALLDSYACLVDVHDMPAIDGYVNGAMLVDSIEHLCGEELDGGSIIAAVERVASMPKQGVASSFKFGCAFGVALGVVTGLKIPMLLPTPTVWKKTMGLTSDKERSRRLAIERWPSHAKAFARKKDEGRAEAALLALWLYERNPVIPRTQDAA